MSDVRVFVVDDHAVVREGISRLLGDRNGFEIVGEAATGREAIDHIAEARPDVTLLDVSMPDLNGLDAICHLKRNWPHGKVVMLSMHDSHRTVTQALRQGVSGYILKDADTAELIRALEAVVQGKTYLSEALNQRVIMQYSSMSRNVDPESPLSQLSNREREVMQLLAEGHTAKEVAAKLFIAAKTVEHHRSRIMAKLGCKNIAELVIAAVKEGLVDP